MIRSLTLIAAGLVAALAAPAVAAAKPAHDLKLYKVERQLSLHAAEGHADVSCEAGDHALDGMWRVDSVDGAAPTAVGVPAAYSDPAAPGTYRFRFVKSVPGQAQLKLFVTCLGSKTSPGGHQHAFSLSGVRTAGFSGGPGVGAGFQPHANACAAGQLAVSPGYALLSGSGRVVGSRPSLPNEADPGRNWAMAFWLDEASHWLTTFRCLTLKSSSAHGHVHTIAAELVGFPQMPESIGAGETKELQTSCGERSKALVGAFDTFPWFAEQDRFLGMDPRIKTRAYRFSNAGHAPMLVWTGAVCLGDRTGKGKPA